MHSSRVSDQHTYNTKYDLLRILGGGLDSPATTGRGCQIRWVVVAERQPDGGESAPRRLPLNQAGTTKSKKRENGN
jgi:hypothetical protein